MSWTPRDLLPETWTQRSASPETWAPRSSSSEQWIDRGKTYLTSASGALIRAEDGRLAVLP
jgi:hypothetical protein